MNGPRDPSLDVRGLSDEEVGALLRQAVAFPSRPDVVPDVLGRIRATASDRGWRWTWPRLSRGLVLALVGSIVAGAVAGAAILGVPGIRIITIEELELPAPAVTEPAWEVDRVSAALDLGIAMSEDDVRARVEMPVFPPVDPALGPPDAVFLEPSLAGGMVSMVWRAQPGLPAADATGVGLLISLFDSEVNPEAFQKLCD